MRMENDEENFQNTKIPNHLLFNLELKLNIINFTHLNLIIFLMKSL